MIERSVSSMYLAWLKDGTTTLNLGSLLTAIQFSLKQRAEVSRQSTVSTPVAESAAPMRRGSDRRLRPGNPDGPPAAIFPRPAGKEKCCCKPDSAATTGAAPARACRAIRGPCCAGWWARDPWRRRGYPSPGRPQGGQAHRAGG